MNDTPVAEISGVLADTNTSMNDLIALSNDASNPDLYIEYNEIINEMIIYSTLNCFTIAGGDESKLNEEYVYSIPETINNLTIYALNLEILGNIKLSSAKKIKIFCKNIIVPKDSKAVIDITPDIEGDIQEVKKLKKSFNVLLENKVKDGKAIIDGSNGKNGDDIIRDSNLKKKYSFNTKKGKTFSGRGENAGDIAIYSDKIDLESTLLVKAEGSIGYPGFDGQDGATGDYGDKEECKVHEKVINIKYGIRRYSVVQTKAPTRGYPGGAGGCGGTGGTGGNGGNVKIMWNTIENRNNLIVNVAGGSPGEIGTPGKGGNGGQGGLYHTGRNGMTVLFDPKSGNRAKNGPIGPKGEHAYPGENGKDGSLTLRANSDRSQFGEMADVLFMQKVLQKIKYRYALCDPLLLNMESSKIAKNKLWVDVGEHLNWFSEVLGRFTGGESGVKEAYNHLLHEASSLNINHKKNISLYGDKSNEVSRIRLELLRNNFEKNERHRQDMERRYLGLVTEYKKNKEVQYEKDRDEEVFKNKVNAYSEIIDDYFKKLDDQEVLVEKTFKELQAAINILKDVEMEIGKAIEASFNFSLDKLCKGLEMLAFTGITGGAGAAMFGIQAANIINTGVSTIKDKSGRDIPKNYVIGTVKQYSIDILKNAISDVTNYDGSYDRGNITAILTDVTAIDQEIENIKGSLSDNEHIVTQAKKALSVVVDKCKSHSREIVTYNAYLANFNDLFKERDDAEEILEKLEAKPDQVTPYENSVVTEYTFIYQSMVQRCLRDLYRINRKYYYLTFNNFLGEALIDAENDNFLYGGTETQKSFTELVDIYERIIEKNFSSDAKESRDFHPICRQNERSLIHISINEYQHPELLKEFKETGKITFKTISENRQAAENEVVVKNTKNKYNIRISHIIPRIIGASCHSADGGFINIKIKHNGHSTFESVPKLFTSNDYTFKHPPVEAQLDHPQDVKREGNTDDDLGRGQMGQLDGAAHDPVGLYANWTIEVESGEDPDAENFLLDLSEVTDLKINFRGFAMLMNG
ncbi:hypothetical protein [Microbulbifer epialgicus]|uniref:Uncharacterized protein n=1 Tax=Microbulbifer epialgicus TaxID=393907 RepID=A0ABV4NVZ4_9GAMM